MMVFSSILVVELILMRPYCHVSEKLRAIYFAIVYIGVSLIRYVNNNVIKGGYNVFLSQMILMMLCFALIWTYFALAMY